MLGFWSGTQLGDCQHSSIVPSASGTKVLPVPTLAVPHCSRSSLVHVVYRNRTEQGLSVRNVRWRESRCYPQKLGRLIADFAGKRLEPSDPRGCGRHCTRPEQTALHHLDCSNAASPFLNTNTRFQG